MPLPLIIPLLLWAGLAALSSWAVSRAIPMSAGETIDIDAPREKVWEAVTNLEGYSEWNDHVVAAEGRVEEGERAAMRVKVPDAQRASIAVKPTFTTVKPQEQLTWRGKLVARWVLTIESSIELKELAGDRTELTQYARFTGSLAPGVPMLASISRTIEASNHKLKALVEG